MKVTKQKYISIMGEFVELMDSVNLEVPSEIKPFYDLYKKIKDNPDVDEDLFEDEEILVGKKIFEDSCNFEIDSVKTDDFIARLVLFVPAAKIQGFQNKMLFSEYRIIITYEHDPGERISNETHMILSALSAGNNVVDLFTYISKIKKIIIREDQVDEFYKFKRVVNGNSIKYTKQLARGTKLAEAQIDFKNAYTLFEKIIMELRVGLGVV